MTLRSRNDLEFNAASYATTVSTDGTVVSTDAVRLYGYAFNNGASVGIFDAYDATAVGTDEGEISLYSGQNQSFGQWIGPPGIRFSTGLAMKVTGRAVIYYVVDTA